MTFDIPRTMRAAVMYDVDDIRIEERPVPTLQPGDLLVRTAASGVCSGDLMPWYVRRKAPFVFGHEPAGTIVVISTSTSTPTDSLMVGDRVFAHHHAPCFACEFCRTGRFVHCATWRSTTLDPGGMAEYFRVPFANRRDTLRLPDGVDFRDASLVEPLGCVVKSLRRAFPSEIGSSVALTPGRLAGKVAYVIGAGVMGAMHIAVATWLGASVYASDFKAERREFAERLGAIDAFDPSDARVAFSAATRGANADAVICGPGSPLALAHAVDTVAADGTVVMFTPIDPGERFTFDQSAAYFRDITLTASYSCGPTDTVDALNLIAAEVVNIDKLGAVLFRFPAVPEAYAAMESATVLKAYVSFE